LPAGLKAVLWSHLLNNQFEQVAFIFAAVERRADGTVFTAKDHHLATSKDFEIQSEFHVELTDEARARVLKRAWDTGTTPVELHSHPGDRWGAMFSPSDLFGFAEFVPHCRWRLRGIPYLAIVISPTGADALAWIDTSDKPIGLTAIRVIGGSAIVPTNQTIENRDSFHSKGTNYGP
jgi:hypothetical protein